MRCASSIWSSLHHLRILIIDLSIMYLLTSVRSDLQGTHGYASVGQRHAGYATQRYFLIGWVSKVLCTSAVVYIYRFLKKSCGQCSADPICLRPCDASHHCPQMQVHGNGCMNQTKAIPGVGSISSWITVSPSFPTTMLHPPRTEHSGEVSEENRKEKNKKKKVGKLRERKRNRERPSPSFGMILDKVDGLSPEL